MAHSNSNTGGLSEAKEYMVKNDIPQLFESMMTALMYEKPNDHIKFLEDCLQKAKVEDKVRWHTFLDPLPDIPKTQGKIHSELGPSKQNNPITISHSKNFAKKDSVLPPITVKPNDSQTYITESENGANQITEKVFQNHIDTPESSKELDNIGIAVVSDRPWYAEYTEREIDTSCLAGKPVIFVLGGPGSGKGTQCAKIVDKYNFTHLSAGDLLRGEVTKGSDIGQKIDAIMKEGQLVPQDVTIALLKQALIDNSHSNGFLVDGFPREIKQGQQFEREVCLAKMVLNYECSDDVLTSRLLARAVHSGRIDDNEESIKKRLVLFHSKTEPVVKYYEDIVASISADRSIDDVFQDTSKAIDRYVFDKFEITKPVVFVLGGPGSGKATQCKRLAEKYNLAHFSAGDLLRNEVAKGSEVAEMIQNIMQSGDKLVPAEITIGLLKDAILSCTSVEGYLIDGFPRQQEQGIQFELEVCPCKLMLFYNCDDEVLVSRLLERSKESGRIDDANEEIIRTRLEFYHTQTTPVVIHYQEKMKMVNGNQSIDEVFDASCAVIENIVFKDASTEEAILPIEESLVQSMLAQELNIGEDITTASKKQSEVNIDEEVIVPVEESVVGGDGQTTHLLKDVVKDKKFIFVIGGPCSGKSTQSVLLVDKLNYAYLTIDGILRNQVEQGMERGLVIYRMIQNGELVPQNLIIEMLSHEILQRHDESEGFLIDGFPENVNQAEEFEKEICTPDMVLYFSCSKDDMVSRMKSSNQANDNDELIEKRMASLESDTLPVVTFYQSKEKLTEICAVDEIDEIFNNVIKEIESVENKPVMANELSNKNIIFVLGGPGCGKGTQCAKIVEKYGYCHLSTGDLLREEVQSGTERATTLKNIMEKGELVSQETILEILRDAMIKRKDCKGFLIDGFPRDVPQGKQFEDTVGKCKYILYFECKNEVMVKRLLKRAETSGRVDDNEETIKKRLKTFEDQTLPVVTEFGERVKQISAERDVDAIFADVCTVLDTLEM